MKENAAPAGQEERPTGFGRILAPFAELFGLSRPAAALAVLLIGAGLTGAFYWFFHSAPPSVLTITSGPAGSASESNAVSYAGILARDKVTLRILRSDGSLENLKRLEDPSFHVDIGFVQSGLTNASPRVKLLSLGSVSYQPLLVFYRGSDSLTLLSEFKGKRLVVGPVGSGTRSLALTLLALNGIKPGGAATLSDLDAEEAATALIDGKVDAVFLMGDSASGQIMKKLLLTPGIQLLSFIQADGYTRKLTYLNKMELPAGSVDFEKNIPPRDVLLVGPAVEILARPNLHPALSDLLIDAAREVHGKAGLLRRKGEFPAPVESEFPISADAARYYKSGKSFFYRSLPFWLASLANRVLLVFIPLLVVLIPGMKIIPAMFRWRVKFHLYRRYRALLAIERDIGADLPPARRQELIARLDQLDKSVNKIKLPASYADQFYGLRGDIGFVRNRLEENAPPV
jgi:TRAP-type uncharacterized transport system substrate-binding protein